MDRAELSVLVVDDDPGVRRLLECALPRHGYTVVAAGDGREAVQVYQARRDAIGVVLLDVQMPGMDGPQTLDALRAVDPAVRAVFMSGCTGRYTPSDLARRGAAYLLTKPFTDLQGVARVLREAAAE